MNAPMKRALEYFDSAIKSGSLRGQSGGALARTSELFNIPPHELRAAIEARRATKHYGVLHPMNSDRKDFDHVEKP